MQPQKKWFIKAKSASQVANYAINNIDAGESIFFSSGIYNLHGSITVTNKNNITLSFDNDSILFISDSMNAPAIMISESDNCLIRNPTINGNAVGQVLSNNNVQGIQIEYSSNCRVDGANIYNVRRFGFYTWGEGCVNNGITNSKITNCGWNAITLGGGLGELSLYAINNEVAYCGDVGITIYGYDSIAQNNYVHDINGTLGSNNAQIGIAIEAGGNNTITGNTISYVVWEFTLLQGPRIQFRQTTYHIVRIQTLVVPIPKLE